MAVGAKEPGALPGVTEGGSEHLELRAPATYAGISARHTLRMEASSVSSARNFCGVE